YNIIPPSASLIVSVRPAPGASMGEIARAMAEVARRASPGITIRTTLAQPPLETTDFASFRPLLGAAGEEPLDLGFWTEAALFEQAGIRAVVYGPGDIAQAHAADEWVNVADLERACDAFAAPLLGGGSP
ncbi:MAG TPA: M20/M25/M40 family metallo-hydrolase, partial [Polyangiaceae bacterium]